MTLTDKSSANTANVDLVMFIGLMSFNITENKTGLRMLPWGIPLFTGLVMLYVIGSKPDALCSPVGQILVIVPSFDSEFVIAFHLHGFSGARFELTCLFNETLAVPRKMRLYRTERFL